MGMFCFDIPDYRLRMAALEVVNKNALYTKSQVTDKHIEETLSLAANQKISSKSFSNSQDRILKFMNARAILNEVITGRSS